MRWVQPPCGYRGTSLWGLYLFPTNLRTCQYQLSPPPCLRVSGTSTFLPASSPRIIETVISTSRGPRTLRGTAVGRFWLLLSNLPRPWTCWEVLCGGRWGGGRRHHLCPAEIHLTGIQDWRAWGHFPLPRWEEGGTVGLSTVTPRVGTVFCSTYLLKSEIIATVIAAIHPALALPQALCWVLWPGDQFLDVGLITPFELLGQ